MEQTVINLVGSLGFPIFTALYFMTRLEKHLQKSNELLTILIERENKGE
jgi:hypothetical protein